MGTFKTRPMDGPPPLDTPDSKRDAIPTSTWPLGHVGAGHRLDKQTVESLNNLRSHKFTQFTQCANTHIPQDAECPGQGNKKYPCSLGLGSSNINTSGQIQSAVSARRRPPERLTFCILHASLAELTRHHHHHLHHLRPGFWMLNSESWSKDMAHAPLVCIYIAPRCLAGCGFSGLPPAAA